MYKKISTAQKSTLQGRNTDGSVPELHKISLTHSPLFLLQENQLLVPSFSVSREVCGFYRVDGLSPGEKEQCMEKVPRAAEKE